MPADTMKATPSEDDPVVGVWAATTPHYAGKAVLLPVRACCRWRRAG
jgi:hypothetical protein